MPGAVLGQGVPPESEILSDFHIGLTMVSGLREAPSAPAWVSLLDAPLARRRTAVSSSGGCDVAWYSSHFEGRFYLWSAL